MARPQQRRSVNRGLLQSVNQTWLPTVNWKIEIPSPNLVRLAPFWEITDIDAYGIPQLVEYTTGNVPTSCTKNLGWFDLTYASGADIGSTFTLPAFDPAIRTSNGAFLASALVFVGTPPGPVLALTAVTPTFNALVGNILTLNNPLTPSDILVMWPTGWANVTQGNTALSANWDGSQLVLTFPTNPASGDEIVYDQLGLASWLIAGNYIGPTTITIP